MFKANLNLGQKIHSVRKNRWFDIFLWLETQTRYLKLKMNKKSLLQIMNLIQMWRLEADLNRLFNHV